MSDQDKPLDGSDNNGGAALLEAVRPELKRPSMYKVILLNDDYTPMEFVVEVLTSYFSHSQQAATEIMLTVHHKGKAVCGIYTKDVADTKAYLVNQYARECEHPLLCEIEPCTDEENGE